MLSLSLPWCNGLARTQSARGLNQFRLRKCPWDVAFPQCVSLKIVRHMSSGKAKALPSAASWSNASSSLAFSLFSWILWHRHASEMSQGFYYVQLPSNKPARNLEQILLNFLSVDWTLQPANMIQLCDMCHILGRSFDAELDPSRRGL